MRIRLPLLMILSFAGLNDSGASPGESAEQPMTVMTFNVRYGLADDGEDSWIHRRNLVFETISEEAPDLIGLQEALRFQMDEIRQQFPGYAEIGTGRDGGNEGEYSAILYRKNRYSVEASGTFWLSDTPGLPSVHWGNSFRRICTWARLVDTVTASPFYYYNTHLDHESQPSRENSARMIAHAIHKRDHADPVILTGDFNAGEDNAIIPYLKGAETEIGTSPVPLLDTFRVMHPTAAVVGTFNGFKGVLDGPKIDFVFVTPDVGVCSASIVRKEENGHTPSDHFPVTARIQLRPTVTR